MSSATERPGIKPTVGLTILLGSLTMFGPISIDMYLPGLPAIASDLESDAAGGQLTIASFLFGLAVGQIIYGPLSDRIGRRPPLTIGISLFVVVSIGCTFATSIEALIGLRFLQALGASGDASAQCALGSMYHLGNGVGKDVRAAMRWYRQAADGGNAVAQWLLGEAYASGSPFIDKHEPEALLLFSKAAEQEDAVGLARLACPISPGVTSGACLCIYAFIYVSHSKECDDCVLMYSYQGLH